MKKTETALKPLEMLTLDASIAELWTRVAKGEAALDEDRRELGRLLAEKRKPFGKRGDGFVEWCKEQGYSQQTVSRLMRYSHSGGVQTYPVPRPAGA